MDDDAAKLKEKLKLIAKEARLSPEEIAMLKKISTEAGREFLLLKNKSAAPSVTKN